MHLQKNKFAFFYNLAKTAPSLEVIASCTNHLQNLREDVGSVVEWLKHRTDDRHGLGSKPTCAILLCPWERHFTALSPAWWS